MARPKVFQKGKKKAAFLRLLPSNLMWFLTLMLDFGCRKHFQALIDDKTLFLAILRCKSFQKAVVGLSNAIRFPEPMVSLPSPTRPTRSPPKKADYKLSSSLT